jgi:hypothetical protein
LSATLNPKSLWKVLRFSLPVYMCVLGQFLVIGVSLCQHRSALTPLHAVRVQFFTLLGKLLTHAGTSINSAGALDQQAVTLVRWLCPADTALACLQLFSSLPHMPPSW